MGRIKYEEAEGSKSYGLKCIRKKVRTSVGEKNYGRATRVNRYV